MITARTKTRRIGNSCGIILPAEILAAMKLDKPGAIVTLSVNDDGQAILEKVGGEDKPNSVFSDFAKYAWAWENEKSAAEMAEELKSCRTNKDFQTW